MQFLPDSRITKIRVIAMVTTQRYTTRMQFHISIFIHAVINVFFLFHLGILKNSVIFAATYKKSYKHKNSKTL
jgi:hypothetical protein